MSTTPNMGMLLPTVSVTLGPLYADENNQAFAVVDSHNHTPGNGAPVPTAAITINADLGFNGYNATLLRSTRYVDQVAPLALITDITCIYTSGGNLYYNNQLGQQVQITAGAALNAASIGGIGGDYGTSTASVFYTSADTTFTFWQDANTPAAIDVGPVTIRNQTLNSFGVTISPPLTLSANYNLTLFSSLPASTKFVTLDNVGQLAAVYDIDNSTIQVIGNIIQVPTGGITSTQIANGTIINGDIADDTIGIIKLQSNLRTPTIFTANGNYTVPADVSSIRIIGCGGGGGGQGGTNGPGSGGGSGFGAPIFEGTLQVVPGETLTIAIGAGGIGSANAASPAVGGNGGNTTITGSSSGLLILMVGGIGGSKLFVSPLSDQQYKGYPHYGGDGLTTGSPVNSTGKNYLLSSGANTGTKNGLGASPAGGAAGGGGGSIGIGGQAVQSPGPGGSNAPWQGGIGAGGGGQDSGFNGAGGGGGDGYVAIYVLT